MCLLKQKALLLYGGLIGSLSIVFAPFGSIISIYGRKSPPLYDGLGGSNH